MAEEKPTTETTTTTETQVAQGTVSQAEYDKIIAEAQELKKQVKEFHAKAKKEEENLLREKGEWQKIAELKDKEAKEAAEKLTHIQTNLVEEKKFSAVREAALKAGMTEQGIKDLELLQLNDIVVEHTSTGRVNVLGVDRFIEVQKQIRPHWFQKPGVVVNGKIPTVTTAAVANESDIIKMSLEASKTGDYTAYKKALNEYKTKRGV